jgi:hypothetical protein
VSQHAVHSFPAGPPFFAARFTALLDLRSTHPRLRERATDVCRAQEDHISATASAGRGRPENHGWSVAGSEAFAGGSG